MPPFDPARKLSELCHRHGLPDSAGERFRALLERAAGTRDDLRERVVELIDRQLRAQAEERATARRLGAIHDEACLQALAPLLHAWRPQKR